MRKGVRASVTTLAIASLCTQGCVIIATNDYEKIPRTDRKLRAPVTPCINVEFAFVPLGDARVVVDPVKGLERLKTHFRQVQSQFGFLQNAREEHPEAAYRLELRVDYTEKGRDSADLSASTMTLWPGLSRFKSNYRAALKTSEGEGLYSHSGQYTETVVYQLFLALVSPISVVFIPNLLRGKET